MRDETSAESPPEVRGTVGPVDTLSAGRRRFGSRSRFVLRRAVPGLLGVGSLLVVRFLVVEFGVAESGRLARLLAESRSVFEEPEGSVESGSLRTVAPVSEEGTSEAVPSEASARASKEPGRGPAVVVPEEVVRSWMRRGVIPEARALSPGALVPAGVAIVGVGRYLPTLSDGDRLVRVEGRPVVAPEEVVREVALAVRAGRSTVRALFVREEGGRLLERRVEIALPRVDERLEP